MAYVIVTADEVTVMAGENADATGTGSTAYKEALELMAIAQIVGWSRYNWADNYSTKNVDVKKAISEYIARFMGVALIAFNMAGFTSRIEAEDMLNIHLHRMAQLEEMFRDQKWQTYAQGI